MRVRGWRQSSGFPLKPPSRGERPVCGDGESGTGRDARTCKISLPTPNFQGDPAGGEFQAMTPSALHTHCPPGPPEGHHPEERVVLPWGSLSSVQPTSTLHPTPLQSLLAFSCFSGLGWVSGKQVRVFSLGA